MSPRHKRLFRLGRRSIAPELDEEIGLHLALRVEQLVRAGLTPDEARREAERRFGDIARTRRRIAREHARHARSTRHREWLAATVHDVRIAARGLRRSPAFTGMVIAILALGIGANAAMFGLIDRLLLRGPAHVRDSDRVVRLYESHLVPGMGDFTTSTVGYVFYAAVRDGTRAFERVAAYSGAQEVTSGRGAEATRVAASWVTWDFFPTLGATPTLGRFFAREETAPPVGENVAVIGHRLWRSRFGGAHDVLGRTIEIGDERYTIIGVAPAGLTGVELAPVDVWLPMSARARRMTDDWARAWDVQFLNVIARLRDDATSARASSEATTAARRAYTGDEPGLSEMRVTARPIWFDDAGREASEVSVSRWLFGVSGVVLLIVCANVVNLLLARARHRRREVAVRVALGAGRGRLVRLLLAESALLALGGAVAGLVAAQWGGALVRRTLLPDVDWAASAVDARVLAFTVAAVVVTTLLIGLVPAVRATRPGMGEALREGAREGGGRRSRLRIGLTMAQAALSAVLLVGAGAFVRSLTHARSLDLGIEPERVLAVSMQWPGAGEADRSARDARVDRSMEAIRTLPGVEHAAVAVGTPFRTRFQTRLRAEGWDSLPTLPGGGPNISAVSSDYFATLGVAILRGRGFTGADRAGSERVTVVNETMARTLWPSSPAIGRCLYVGQATECTRVVGVAEDARRYALREPPAMQYYVPLGQESGMGGRMLLVRTRGNPEALAPTIRRTLLELEPSLRWVDIHAMQDFIDPLIRPWRLGATLFGLFGALALVVAAVGLYSVIAYGVAERTREVGVRLALGARAGDVVRLVVREGVLAGVVGLLVGLGLAVAAASRLEPLLFETSPRSPAVLAVVAITLLAAAAVASLVPAWRATRIDPAVALRME